MTNEKWKHYVQYTEDGTIQARVSSTHVEAPPHPRQLVFEDEIAPEIDGMRVDLKTKKLIPCPKIAKERHNGNILRQLQALDAATPRALRDFHLKGDKTALQNLEDQAAKLRPQLKA